MGLYVISKNVKGKYYSELQNSKGKVIFTTQKYMARKGALKGTRSIMANAKIASIEDRTCKNQEYHETPKFIIYKKDNKFYCKLIAINGKDVGTSNPLRSLADAKATIKEIKANSNSKLEKWTVDYSPKAKRPAVKKVAKKPAKKVVKKATKKAVKKTSKKK